MRCRCGFEFPEMGFVPARDAFSGLPVCEACTKAQREARRAFHVECAAERGDCMADAVRMAEVDVRETW